MKVTCVLWPQISHKLFDYESCELLTNTIEVDGPALLAVQDFLPDLEERELVLLDKSGDCFEVYPVEGDKLWKIVDKEKYSLMAPGQYLKIGRKMFRVRTKCLKPRLKGLKGYLGSQQDTCRICFQFKTQQDPLVSPCDCKGSIKFAHFSCFCNVIKPFIQIQKVRNVTRFTVKKMVCEISKCQIDKKILKKSLIFGFLGKYSFKEPFLALDYFDSNKEYSIIIFELSEGEEICIGRSSGAEFCVPGISISRKHAVIKAINGEFWVKDSGSRYGTLLSSKKLQLTGQEENLQIKNCVLNFFSNET